MFPTGAGGISATLNQVSNPVITQLQCASVYGGIIDHRIVCTDTSGGMGTCSVRRYAKNK